MSTITFTRTSTYELDFETWYSKRKSEYKSEEKALKKWEAMTDKVSKWEMGDSISWDDLEDSVYDVENEVEDEDETTEEMEDLLLKITHLFENIGIRFFADYSCCMTCGHSEAKRDTENGSYVFYHGQDGDSLRKGANAVYLSHDIKEDKIDAFAKMLEENKDIIHYSGYMFSKIFATYDPDVMKKHIVDDAEHTERVLEMMKKRIEEEDAKEKKAASNN